MTGRRFGKAVQRNLVRRRLRESVRALRQQLGEAWDLVLIPRPAARALTYDQLRGSVSCLLRRAGVIASDG
jgi:ribonuclease P protein component